MALAKKKPRRRHPPRAVTRPAPMGGSGGIRLISDGDRGWADLYHRLFTMSWPLFFAFVIGVWLFFNLVLAGIYFADPGGVSNARPGSYSDNFFFSIQTMATVGFGDMHPKDLFANIVATAEVLLGFGTIAITTALIFARFSRPTARVMFSDVTVIAPYDGVPTLMFRAANRRSNQILEAQINVAVLRDEITGEGKEMRRFHDLALSRGRTPIFSLSWTVMHPITESSPLYGATPESLAAQDARIIVTMTGIDETFSSTIHARHIYAPDRILWNRHFADILTDDADGVPMLDYRRFHDTEPVAGKVALTAAAKRS
jgi:inward rectifier potassium channel